MPLPWTTTGASFGFGEAIAHIPQPTWFSGVSVEAEEADPASSLALYRDALRLRRELHTEEKLEWLDDLSGDTVLAFARPGGWVNVTNFGAEPVALPDAEVLLTSSPLQDGLLSGAATAWLRA